MKRLMLGTVMLAVCLAHLGCEPEVDCGDGFHDSKLDLCWMIPANAPIMRWQDATDYCGRAGWRLPTIDELRSLVIGCPGTPAAGTCRVRNGSPTTDWSLDDGCACGDFDGTLKGPGKDGCYWTVELNITAQGEDINTPCKRLWSASIPSDLPADAWAINLFNGKIFNHGKLWAYDVSCVKKP